MVDSRYQRRVGLVDDVVKMLEAYARDLDKRRRMPDARMVDWAEKIIGVVSEKK